MHDFILPRNLCILVNLRWTDRGEALSLCVWSKMVFRNKASSVNGALPCWSLYLFLCKICITVIVININIKYPCDNYKIKENYKSILCICCLDIHAYHNVYMYIKHIRICSIGVCFSTVTAIILKRTNRKRSMEV